MSETMEAVLFWCVGIFAVVTLFGGCAFLCSLGDRYTCSSIGRRTSKATSYSIVSGCFIEVDGQMVPLANWRVQ